MSVTLSLSIFNNPYWDSVALMLGDLALLVFFVWLIFLMITVGLFSAERCGADRLPDVRN